MNPKMLSEGLKKISGMLTPEQLSQMEKAIKNVDKGKLNQQLNSLNAADLQKELQKNPQLLSQLAKNPELLNQLQKIFNQK